LSKGLAVAGPIFTNKFVSRIGTILLSAGGRA